MEELGTMAKDKKGSWIKSCKQSMKRKTEVLVMADELKAFGKTDENTRTIIMRGLQRLRKIQEEEATKELVEEVQDRKQQLEEGTWKDIEQYIISWDQERRRSSTLNAKIWQLVHSSTTKVESLEERLRGDRGESSRIGLERRQKVIQVLVGARRVQGS